MAINVKNLKRAVKNDLSSRLARAQNAAKDGKNIVNALRQCEKMLIVLKGLKDPSKKSISTLIKKDKPLNRNVFRTSDTKKLLNKIHQAASARTPTSSE